MYLSLLLGLVKIFPALDSIFQQLVPIYKDYALRNREQKAIERRDEKKKAGSDAIDRILNPPTDDGLRNDETKQR